GLARKRPGWTHFSIHIFHVAARLALDFSRMPGEGEGCGFEGNRREAQISILSTTVDENAVPVNLLVRNDANAARAYGQLAGEVGRHGARTARGKSHVIEHSHPAAMRVERFHVGCDG